MTAAEPAPRSRPVASTRRIGRNETVLRILARPPAPMSSRRAGTRVRAVLAGTAWGEMAPLRVRLADPDAEPPADTDLLIEVAVDGEIGSPSYASQAHDLVQRLYDTATFTRVEADIPVAAFAPPPVDRPGVRAAERCGASSADVDWVRDELHVAAALAQLPAGVDLRSIRIGHPDSGYTDHGALRDARLALDLDRDVISDDDDARDPLRPPRTSFWNALPNPGHGTSTASVIVGDGDPSGLRGVAVGVTLVPIRATESVVQVFDTDVAKAVRWARRGGCAVVSMSLGGKGLFGLQDAIGEAVDDGMIVMAAAGNKVGFVTAPASYDNCIAVAATGPGGARWSGSSRGAAVDVSAPGACVWCAQFDWDVSPPGFVVRRSHGTSYAVAHLAGVAALWLAVHGRDTIAATYGRRNVQAAFLYVLRRPGVCARSADWSEDWGVGVVDAAKVLAEPLPPPHVFAGRAVVARGAGRDPIARLAAHAGRPPAEVAAWVDARLGPGTSADLDALHRFEGELAYHLATGDLTPAPIDARRAAGAERDGPPAVPTGASPQLAARLRATHRRRQRKA